MTTMRLCELDDDEVFDVTSTSDADINADLAAVITLSYKLSFKFIKLSFKFIKSSFKSNLKTSRALSFEIAFEALFKSAILSH